MTASQIPISTTEVPPQSHLAETPTFDQKAEEKTSKASASATSCRIT